MGKIYLDYNATAPLSHSVLSFMKSGDFINANPNALYQSGKKANQLLSESLASIKSYFPNISELGLFFHSGASEGISTFFNLAPSDVMVFFESDHPAVHAIGKMNKEKGATVIMLPIMVNGYFNEEELIKVLKPYSDKRIYLNYTFVHNETGVVWPIEEAVKLKQKLNCFVHIDCAQSVGKTENWNILDSSIDQYTFSSHKLGGTKGVGFSFVNMDFPFRPLIPGGGQQNGLRGGTVNILGVITTALALKDIQSSQNFIASLLLRDKVEGLFEKYIADDGFVVLKDELRAVNTSLLCFKKQKGDFLQTKFDMFGIEVSYGSACSSGSIKGSQTMISLGYTDYANSIIRLSFGVADYHNEQVILDGLEKVLKSL